MTAAELLSYEVTDAIATITMDDGKANVMSEAMLSALASAFDRAEKEAVKVVVLTGRPGFFSGGYDIGMFKRSQDEIRRTVCAGGELVYRIFDYSRPVLIAAPGHAIAQGSFLLLAADARIGVTGARKTGMNEVNIGMIIPQYAVEISRARLTPAWFNHAACTGTLYTPELALQAGFYDQLVAPEALAEAARAEAVRMCAIDLNAYVGTKRRVRGPALRAIRAGLDEEFPGGH
jgi:enoyl-CoA hydratase